MQNEQIIIPEGWTYYAHRTNTDRWSEDPFTMNSITVKKLMSVVTERDIYQEIVKYGKSGLKGYSLGKGTPFEIRCLICKLPYLQAMDDSVQIKDIMLKEFYYDKNNIGGAYGQRHHSIPKDEELVVLGIGNYDEIYDKEQKIIWTIPRRFIKFYIEEVKKGRNRGINLIFTLNNERNEHRGNSRI